jgi:trk system potassium uptake protein TrkH
MESVILPHKKHKPISPTRRIAFSFMMVILIGSVLLSLPISHRTEISYIDHLFTAVSATCVTGLVTVTVKQEYTLIGQIIILIMIQIGGLGFLTFLSLFFVKFTKKLSYKNKLVMQEALNMGTLKDINYYIKRVFHYTIFFEGLGAFLLSLYFIPHFGILKGIYYAIFHSVSAFCNGGFDVLGDSSLINYATNPLINIVISALIIEGGLGFIVWIELKDKLIQLLKKKHSIKKSITSLSVHSKIVLVMTVFLLISGTFIFFLLEYSNTLSGFSFIDKIQISFFQSATLRTAGFASVDMSQLKTATKLVMAIYMFIGGSPAGTAGGVKTVTFALVLLSVHALVKGKEEVSIFKKNISSIVVKRALVISFIYLSISLISLFVLSITENKEFIDLIFEVYSAIATVGLTAGLTPHLTVIGKIIIMILMYIGRIGPLTMVLIFVKRYNQLRGKEIQYPLGDVLIG